MNFVSYVFAIFLAALLLIHFFTPPRWRFLILLIASYLFYATWSLPFIAVILVSTTADYYLSKMIHNGKRPMIRKLVLIAGIAFNLVVLGFFKYCNFFLDTAHGLAHWLDFSLNLPLALQIVLPLGISFYTFEAISYIVDVYRGEKPAKSWLDYNFYIMYFPHLISGPIIRYQELASQYQKPLELPDNRRIVQGCKLIILGYFFKILIADQVASIADPVFADILKHSPYQTLLGVMAFTVQIYFDFMGYTHIARGVSLLFNIELPLDFNHPYLASNISAFWERWHISLSRWIRDYLYFPLGGSRSVLLHTCMNLIITMLICGAWHGAGWTYIVWGAYHGLLLSVYHLYKHLKKSAFSSLSCILTHPLYQGFSVGLTFIAVVLGWVLFRVPDLKTAGLIFNQLIQVNSIVSELITIASSRHLTDLFTLLLLLFCCLIGPVAVKPVTDLIRPLPFWAKAQIACFTLIMCWIISSSGSQSFIYFQF